jgi:hypothetical protein
MRNLLLLLILCIFFSGCTSFVKGTENYMSEDYYLKKEAELKTAYEACLKRNGNVESKCSKEKDDLLQQQEWNEMEESG